MIFLKISLISFIKCILPKERYSHIVHWICIFNTTFASNLLNKYIADILCPIVIIHYIRLKDLAFTHLILIEKYLFL